MSVQSEITRLSDNVTAALAAIAGKGVTVPDGSNSDSLASLIAAIEAGGGVPGYQMKFGTYTPIEDVTNVTEVYITDKIGTATQVSNYIETCFCVTFIAIANTDYSVVYPTAGAYLYCNGKNSNLSFKSSSTSSSTKLGSCLSRKEITSSSYGLSVSLLCDSTYPLKAGQTYMWVLLIPDSVPIQI